MEQKLTYHYCSFSLISNEPIPELTPGEIGKSAFHFTYHPPINRVKEFAWTHHWKMPNGQTSLAYRRGGLHHWLRFPGLADFQISQDAFKVDGFPLAQVPAATIHHLLLDQVLPRCLAHQGHLMLHSSAVGVEQGALLFIGGSGAGKSTLAGNFHQAGLTALADDCVWIKEHKLKAIAVPSYGGLRLWEDSLKFILTDNVHVDKVAHYSSKKRVSFEQSVQETGNGYPILAVFVINPMNEKSLKKVTLELLSRREAYMEMVKQTFLLDVNDYSRTAGHLKTLAQLLPSFRVYRLDLPRNYQLLPKVRKSILEKIAV